MRAAGSSSRARGCCSRLRCDRGESDLKPPDPIVSVELMGGLGNQMFQYAAGHALARRKGAALRLDLGHFAQSGKRRYLLDCFAVPAPVSQEPSPNAWRGLAHWLA